MASLSCIALPEGAWRCWNGRDGDAYASSCPGGIGIVHLLLDNCLISVSDFVITIVLERPSRNPVQISASESGQNCANSAER